MSTILRTMGDSLGRTEERRCDCGITYRGPEESCPFCHTGMTRLMRDVDSGDNPARRAQRRRGK